MLRRAAWIWSMHSLAFLAVVVVAAVAGGALWALVPTTWPNWLQLGMAASVSITAVGLAYGLYLTLISFLLDVEFGWGFYLGGPFVVLGAMGLLFVVLTFEVLNFFAGAVAFYVLLFLLGGAALSWRMRGEAVMTGETEGGRVEAFEDEP